MLKKVIKQKALLILVSLILVLCAGFIFISCGIGTGPQMKVLDPDKGAYALDFADNCPGIMCRVLFSSNEFQGNPTKTMADKELTMEVWIKSKATGTSYFDGGIFGRLDIAGMALLINNGVPKAGIRRIGERADHTTAAADYIVTSDVTLGSGWNHIAAVLTGDNHSDGQHDDCGDRVASNTTVGADCLGAGNTCNDDIHLDIYVNGVYAGCNTTWGDTTLDAFVFGPTYTGEPGDKSFGVGVMSESVAAGGFGGFDGSVTVPAIIDEPRMWGSDRSQADIQACMNTELGNHSGTCGRDRDDLIIYLRLNEGERDSVSDWSGLGSGILEWGDGTAFHHWTTGWTTDTPNLIEAD